jgi:hypothetical protein
MLLLNSYVAINYTHSPSIQHCHASFDDQLALHTLVRYILNIETHMIRALHFEWYPIQRWHMVTLLGTKKEGVIFVGRVMHLEYTLLLRKEDTGVSADSDNIQVLFRCWSMMSCPVNFSKFPW